MANNKKTQNDNIFLNGPVNYFKLSNAGKEINLFMDFHAPISRQRKCLDYDAKDIDKYLEKILLENNSKPIDFFLEINPTSINCTQKYYSNDNYLQSVRKMFSSIYKQTNKTSSQSVRLHYMDIRDYASFNSIKNRFNIINSLLEKTKLNDLAEIIKELTIIRNILLFIDQMIKSIINNKEYKTKSPDKKDFNYKFMISKKIDFVNLTEIQTSDSEQRLTENQIMDVGLYQILEKILTNYSKTKNKDKIIELFKTHYIDTSAYVITELTNLIEKLIKLDKVIDDHITGEKITFEKINYNNKSYARDILPYYYYPVSKYKHACRDVIDSIEIINTLVMKMGVIIVDCYFLRRLIDNPNISKSIVYTGAYHTVVYLWFLVKYCNYNIDNYNYINPKIDIQKLIALIRKSDYLDIMEYVIPDKVNQCVEIKKI